MKLLMRNLALRRLVVALFILIPSTRLFAQTFDRCGTMQLLQNTFKQDPSLQSRFEARERLLQQKVALRLSNSSTLRTEATSITVPVVFHVVMTNPNLVTDAQLQAQVDTLNKDYAGLNGDSIKIPAYFKPLFGKTGIRFSLARRTPQGEATTGIERVVTGTKSYSSDTSGSRMLKHTGSGGTDAWDPDQYLNVWITNLSNGVLGYATFPATSLPDEQGIAIMYTSLPGGSAIGYNQGKTLTHEIGHYFNLRHIWGDDNDANGRCSGTDFVDDTPNQSSSTTECRTGIVTDICTPSGSGIMYQNYMDYTPDNCLVMFTNQQALRMETALSTFRASLFNSLGAVPLVRFNRDADLRVINNPSQRICSPAVAPAVTIRNLGIQPLTSLTVNAVWDNGGVSSVTWTGSLPSLGTASVTLNLQNVTPGTHLLTFYTSNPNGNPDEYTFNDTLRLTTTYYPPFNPPVTESFEGNVFPSTGWDIVNPDKTNTWQKVTGVAKTGNASVMIGNFNNAGTGRQDYLRLPEVAIGGADSAFIEFQVAAAAYSALTTANNPWDTLEVLLSTNCGSTYTSLYKKWGASLVTRQTATVQSFVPAANEWRKDSVDITPYISSNNIMLAFRNTNENENNIYLDDVRVYTKIINPNLKARGYLVTPNPTSGLITIQFYPQPVNLRGIAIYSAAGQQITTISIPANQTRNLYTLDVSNYRAGMYFVRMLFTDRVLTDRFLKF